MRFFCSRGGINATPQIDPISRPPRTVLAGNLCPVTATSARRSYPDCRKLPPRRSTPLYVNRVTAHLLGARQNYPQPPLRFAQFKCDIHRGILFPGGCVGAIEIHRLGPLRLVGCNPKPTS